MEDFETEFSSEAGEESAQQQVNPQGEFAATPRAEQPYAEQPRVNGDYHFVRPDRERSAYSDADYVPAEDASEIPHSYHYTVPAEEKPKRRKKQRRGMHPAAVIALCLVCALLGGAAGIGGGALYLKKATPAASGESNTVINVAASTGTPVTTNVVISGQELTPTEIYYNLALNQVVGVTTEITYTNFWGYTSSSAVSGSGFIISENGYILTNYHVIEDAVTGGYEIKVLNYAGDEYTAAVVGYEEDNDVAVLKIEASGLSAATIGDSDAMQVGEMVYPVGNPLGELQYSMTDGMVSALDREISSYDTATQTYKSVNMFQISAAINSGNSGGPVYNSRGEVIGIATAKYSQTGVESLGFAIPINDAIKIANDLISDGYVRGKAYLGVTAGTVTASAAQYYGLVEGAIINSVNEGSCAEKAGLQPNDIIVAVDGKEVTSIDTLNAAKRDYRAGDSAVLKVYRNGSYVELTITFDEETPEVLEADEKQQQQQQQQQQGGNQYDGQYGDRYGGQYGDSYDDFFDFFFGSDPFGR